MYLYKGVLSAVTHQQTIILSRFQKIDISKKLFMEINIGKLAKYHFFLRNPLYYYIAPMDKRK